ncbi:hypothetical protein Tco_0861115 [Tanacetum coccineum]|uniref:Reverse transcriptase domain-containing protein n=1 Tax=Tanacetum coccineum TaxID=301880 RepID=A0ABQ5BKL0_9ASTR
MVAVSSDLNGIAFLCIELPFSWSWQSIFMVMASIRAIILSVSKLLLPSLVKAIVYSFLLEDLEAVPADYVPAGHAMRLEDWIPNADQNFWRIASARNSPKRLGKRCERNTIVHPPDTLIAFKARFGGNEESKKMRKTMLKQQFSEFSVIEEEGLHKGYDRFQKILSQLNQVQARPDNYDINLKFLRALPSLCPQNALDIKNKGGLDSMSFDDLYNKLRSLELDVKIGHSYGVKADAAPTHSAFIGAASSGSRLTYSDQQSIVPSVCQTSGVSDNNKNGNVFFIFCAENGPDQDMIYEDFDQVD